MSVNVSENAVRQLLSALHPDKPVSTWTTKRLEMKLPSLIASGDVDTLEDKADREVFRTVSRAMEEGESLEIEKEKTVLTATLKNPVANGESKKKPKKSPAKGISASVASFNLERMQEQLGWAEVGKNDPHHFKINGQCILLENNLCNRPFRLRLAQRWKMEYLRGKWALNGESFIVDANGMTQSGQHRGVGLILAELERRKDPDQWGKKPIIYETVFVTGIEPKNEIVDTIDLAQKRGLGDVLFRNREMGDVSDKQQKRMARILAGALRVVWLRLIGQSVVGGKTFLHSEALDVLAEHPNLHDCVAFITEKDGTGENGKCISATLSPAYAAGLMYLMSRAKGGMSKAKQFWAAYATGAFSEGEPLLALKKKLERSEASSSQGRQEIIGVICKAYQLWLDGKTGVKPSDLNVKKGEDPRFGGIDIAPKIEEEVEE